MDYAFSASRMCMCVRGGFRQGGQSPTTFLQAAREEGENREKRERERVRERESERERERERE